MEDGKILIKDIPFILLPSFFIEELSIYFIKNKKIPQLYMLAWFWGYVFTDQIKNRFNLQKPDEIYRIGMDLIEAMGIGLYKTHNYKLGRYTNFTIPNNPFVQKIDMSTLKKQHFDYFISGFMAGGGSHVHNQPCQCIELLCRVNGDTKCDFLTGTEKELKSRKLWSTAVKRYDLKTIYPIQKKIFNRCSDENKEIILSEIMNLI
ncbi:MAG: hypothetical protein U9O53_01110 [archaeon]|nr:hypothetical protein [archaeon]